MSTGKAQAGKGSFRERRTRTLLQTLLQDRSAHHFIHLELRAGLGAEELLGARGDGKLLDHVGEQQEVVEEEAVQLLIALGLVQLPAVQQLPGPQAVGEGIENQLLKERSGQCVSPSTNTQHAGGPGAAGAGQVSGCSVDVIIHLYPGSPHSSRRGSENDHSHPQDTGLSLSADPKRNSHFSS